LPPILVTLLGIVTLVNPLQRENACSPMVVTLLGIVTLVMSDLPLKMVRLLPLIPRALTEYPPSVLGIVTLPPGPL
jgi:hypothetical protein